MRTSGAIGYSGHVQITTFQNGTIVRTAHIQNMITNDWLNNIAQGMVANADTEIKYIALGAGSTEPDETDTVLESEQFRKIATRKDRIETGTVQSTFSISSYEANFLIEEVGFFGGEDATEQVNSGILVARILFEKEKTELESIQFVRTDTISRG